MRAVNSINTDKYYPTMTRQYLPVMWTCLFTRTVCFTKVTPKRKEGNVLGIMQRTHLRSVLGDASPSLPFFLFAFQTK